MKFISVSDRLKEIRCSSQYKKWRDKILEKDERKCVLCGSVKNLEVDHIKSLSLNPNLALDINNGRTLCKECHKKTDTYGVYSRFKETSNIHPVLRGNLFFKLQSLPAMIQINDKNIGFSLLFDPKINRWRAGYRFARVNLTFIGDNIEDAVDGLFDKLKYSK